MTGCKEVAKKKEPHKKSAPLGALRIVYFIILINARKLPATPGRGHEAR